MKKKKKSHKDKKEELLNKKLQDKNKMELISKIDSLTVEENNYFMVGKLNEAVEIAKRIITIAKKGDLKGIIKEQEDFIEQVLGKKEENRKKSQIKDLCELLTNKFNSLVSKEEIQQAHKIVRDFKDKHDQEVDLYSIDIVRKLLDRDRAMWEEFTNKQAKLQIKLENLEKEFGEAMQSNQFKKVENLISQANQIIPKIKLEDFSDHWALLEDKFLKEKAEYELKNRIEHEMDEIIQLKEKFLFKNAIIKINELLDMNLPEDLGGYQAQFNNLKEQIQKTEKEYKEKLDKLSLIEEKLDNNVEKDHLKAALSKCLQIIQILKEIGKNDELTKYQELKTNLEEKLEKREQKKKAELEKLKDQAKELEGVIQVEENVLPLVDELSVDEALGDLSEDISEMLNQVSGLLDEHRVEIKKEITNKALLKSKSGEVSELEQKIEVPEPEEEKEKEEVQLNVESVVSNPFDDVIEEAILTDLIPYNFEIDKVELNGELVDQLPDKSLTKEGLELNWRLENIPPKENVNVNYNLRRRVSRTIIFVLKGKVKVIKTHSKITKQDIEGLFEADLPFTNSYGIPLKGVVMEDIIPLYYLHFVEEPKHILPNKVSKTDSGDLLKWDMETVKEETLSYHYNLLEIYKFEELKINAISAHDRAMEELKKGDIINALGYFEKIKKLIANYIK